MNRQMQEEEIHERISRAEANRNSQAYKTFYNILETSVNDASDYLMTLWHEGYGVNAVCPHCGGRLLKSDVEDYHSVCLMCDENFYEFEEEPIKEGN